MISHAAVMAINLPDDTPNDGQDSEAADDARSTEGLGREHLHCRVLIVEDDYFVALTIVDALRGAGYSVLGPVVTGEEAVAMAAEQRPDLVLMDIRLAGVMDGVDAAVEIARMGIRSLFVTAHSDDFTRQRGAQAQPHGWVEKPFSDAQLLDAVAAAVASGRS